MLLRLLSYSLRWVAAGPLWLALWGVFMAACAGVLLTVSLLLGRQVLLLLRGHSYLDTLRQGQAGGSRGSSSSSSGGVSVVQRWRRARPAFGSSPLITLLLPPFTWRCAKKRS